VLVDVHDIGVFVLVSVPVVIVRVAVQVNEIGGEQQGPVREDLFGRARREDPPVLPEHEDPPGDLRDDVEVVRGRHHRFSLGLRLEDDVYELPAAPGVQTCSGLIQQEDLRIHNQHGGDRNLFLLSPREFVGRAVCKRTDPERLESIPDFRPDLPVGLNSCASEFWKRIPTSFRKNIPNGSRESKRSSISRPKAR
jgi:hypothetical protein